MAIKTYNFTSKFAFSKINRFPNKPWPCAYKTFFMLNLLGKLFTCGDFHCFYHSNKTFKFNLPYSLKDKLGFKVWAQTQLSMDSSFISKGPGFHVSFENTVGKGEIARYEQFLLFPQCFLPFRKIFLHFHQIQNCHLQTISVRKSLEFDVWKRVKDIKSNWRDFGS